MIPPPPPPITSSISPNTDDTQRIMRLCSIEKKRQDVRGTNTVSNRNRNTLDTHHGRQALGGMASVSLQRPLKPLSFLCPWYTIQCSQSSNVHCLCYMTQRSHSRHGGDQGTLPTSVHVSEHTTSLVESRGEQWRRVVCVTAAPPWLAFVNCPKWSLASTHFILHCYQKNLH